MAASVIAEPRARINTRVVRTAVAKAPVLQVVASKVGLLDIAPADVAASKDFQARVTEAPRDRRSGGCVKMVRE